MGLELVELALAIEIEFDIHIPDAKLEEILTPRDYVEYIVEEHKRKIEKGYTFQKGFYKLRRIFIEELGLKREDIKPCSKLEVLLQPNIRKSWKKLNKALDKKLHYHTLYINKTGNMVILGLLTLIAFFMNQNDSIEFTFPALFGALMFLSIWGTFFSIILRPIFGKKVPSYLKTISSLLCFLGYTQRTYTSHKNYGYVAERVLEISIEQLGVSSDEITLDSHFVDDLGVG